MFDKDKVEKCATITVMDAPLDFCKKTFDQVFFYYFEYYQLAKTLMGGQKHTPPLGQERVDDIVLDSTPVASMSPFSFHSLCHHLPRMNNKLA